jgi:hypothetical protein
MYGVDNAASCVLRFKDVCVRACRDMDGAAQLSLSLSLSRLLAMLSCAIQHSPDARRTSRNHLHREETA